MGSFGICLELRFWTKAENSRENICRETAHRHIIVSHYLCITGAFGGNAVFGAFEHGLEIGKLCVGPFRSG